MVVVSTSENQKKDSQLPEVLHMSLLCSDRVQLNPQVSDEDNLCRRGPEEPENVAASRFCWLVVLDVGGGHVEEIHLKHSSLEWKNKACKGQYIAISQLGPGND